jgi:hypothetical protein
LLQFLQQQFIPRISRNISHSDEEPTSRAPTHDEVVEEAKHQTRHQTITRFVQAKNKRLSTNLPPDSDPEALETFVPSAESDSEVESEDGAFKGREHYEAVAYARLSN